MAQLNSFASTFALTISAASVVLLGCSAEGGNEPQTNPYASNGGSSFGGAPAGTGNAPVVGAGNAPVAGGGAAQVGTGGAPVAGGGAPPVGTGGGPVAVGGAPAGTGGTPVSVGGAPAGTGGAPSNGTWDPKANLDANGVLIPPAPASGFQISTTQFDLNPGQEIFNCYHVATPNDAEYPVGEWDAQMSSGSHHFILYRAGNDTTASGTLVPIGCTSGFGGQTWLYTQGSPRSHLLFPDGVAMPLKAHERIIFDMHYINTGTSVIHAKISLNVNKVKSATFQKADAQVSFNTSIRIPANGMQTVGGDCTPAAGANYFIMQTHTHKRGILAVVNRKLASGQLGEELVKTTNWDSPNAHVWQQAPFLTFQPGEKFHYSCTFQNDRASVVTVGTSAENNEMCMAEAYFFPASASVPGCN